MSHGTEDDAISISIEAGVATITLNRPASGNALDRDALHALMLAAISVDEDPDVRCVLLTGTGRLFCSGGDVASFAGSESLPTLMKEITVYLHAAVSRLMRMEKPLVVAVNGTAAGAGLGLAMTGDIVLAADTASFTTAYGAIGLTPDGGVSWSLPRLIGLRRAQEMAITSRRVGAAEAVEIGLITRMVPAANLMDEARSTATAFARSGSGAVGGLRELFLASLSATLETHLEAEAKMISRMTATPDAKSLLTDFLGRRRP